MFNQNLEVNYKFLSCLKNVGDKKSDNIYYWVYLGYHLRRFINLEKMVNFVKEKR